MALVDQLQRGSIIYLKIEDKKSEGNYLPWYHQLKPTNENYGIIQLVFLKKGIRGIRGDLFLITKGYGCSFTWDSPKPWMPVSLFISKQFDYVGLGPLEGRFYERLWLSEEIMEI